MTLLALRMFFGGILSKIMAFLRSLNGQGVIGLIVAVALAFLLVRAESESRHWHKQSDRYEKLYTAEHSGRITDRQAYVTAQAQAAALNKAHVATENRLREQINETSRDSFIADRDRLRAEAGAAKGSAGATGVPGIPKAVPGTPPEVVSLPPAELLRAQELELQLNALIDWVLAQTSVKPN